MAGSGAFIGNRQHVGLDRLHEQHSAEVRGGADARVRVAHLVLVRLDVGEELLQVLGGEGGLADDRHRHLVHQADELEIGERVEPGVAVERRDGRHADVVDQDLVAVGLRGLDELRREDAAGARPVLDDHRLAHRLSHRLGEDARHRVRGTSRGVGHDHGDRAVGIVLGRRGGGERECRRAEQKPTKHGSSPPVECRNYNQPPSGRFRRRSRFPSIMSLLALLASLAAQYAHPPRARQVARRRSTGVGASTWPEVQRR
jgi:hypothetical protein